MLVIDGSPGFLSTPVRKSISQNKFPLSLLWLLCSMRIDRAQMGWLQNNFFTLCWNTFVAFLSRGKPNTWLEFDKNGSQQAYLWLSKIKEVGSFTAAGGPCAGLFLLLCQLLPSPPNRTGIQATIKPAGSGDSGLPPSLGFQSVSQRPIHPWFAMQSCSLHHFFLGWWGKRRKEWLLLFLPLLSRPDPGCAGWYFH